jgi:hypothetical protein
MMYLQQDDDNLDVDEFLSDDDDFDEETEDENESFSLTNLKDVLDI